MKPRRRKDSTQEEMMKEVRQDFRDRDRLVRFPRIDTPLQQTKFVKRKTRRSGDVLFPQQEEKKALSSSRQGRDHD